jgi:hypothetical protein
MAQPEPTSASEIPTSKETYTVSKYGQDRQNLSFFQSGSRPEQLTLIGSLVENIKNERGPNPVFKEGQRSFETSLKDLHLALQNKNTYDQNPDAYNAMYFSYIDAVATAGSCAPSSPEAKVFEQNYGHSPKDFIDMIGTTQIFKEKKHPFTKEFKTSKELTNRIISDTKQELHLLEAAYSPTKAFNWFENRIIQKALKKGTPFVTGADFELLVTGTNFEQLSQKGKESLREKVTLPSGAEITVGNYDLTQEQQRTQLVVDMTRSRTEEILNPNKEELQAWAEEVESAPDFVKEATKDDNFSLLEQKILEQHAQIKGLKKQDLIKYYQDLLGGGNRTEITSTFTTISPEAKQKATKLLHLPISASQEQIQKALLKLKTDNRTEYNQFSDQMLTVVHQANKNLHPYQPVELAINFYASQYKEAQLEILEPATDLEQLPSEFFEQIESKHIAFFLLQKVPIRQLRTQLKKGGFSQDEIDKKINNAIETHLKHTKSGEKIRMIKSNGQPELKVGVEDETFDDLIEKFESQKLEDFNTDIQEQAKKEVQQEIINDKDLQTHYDLLIQGKILEKRKGSLKERLINNLPDSLKSNEFVTLLNQANVISQIAQGGDITTFLTDQLKQKPALIREFNQYAAQQKFSIMNDEVIKDDLDYYEKLLLSKSDDEGKQLFEQAKQELFKSDKYEAKKTAKACELRISEYTRTNMPLSQLDEFDTLTLATMVDQGHQKKDQLPQDITKEIDQVTTNNKLDPKKVTSYLSSHPQHFSSLDWISISLFIDAIRPVFNDLNQEQQQQIQQLGGLT